MFLLAVLLLVRLCVPFSSVQELLFLNLTYQYMQQLFFNMLPIPVLLASQEAQLNIRVWYLCLKLTCWQDSFLFWNMEYILLISFSIYGQISFPLFFLCKKISYKPSGQAPLACIRLMQRMSIYPILVSLTLAQLVFQYYWLHCPGFGTYCLLLTWPFGLFCLFVVQSGYPLTFFLNKKRGG